MVDFVLGDELKTRFIPEFKEFQKEYFIFSAWKFYKIIRKKKNNQLTFEYIPGEFKPIFNQLKKQGIHIFCDHAGRILLDSGGFQLIRKQLDLDFRDTLQVYNAAQFTREDFGICLDYCPRAYESPTLRIKKIEQTNTNYRAMITQNPKILHVIHGWTRKELDLSLNGLLSPSTLTQSPPHLPMMAMNGAFDEILESNKIKELLIRRFLIFQDLLKQKNLDHICIHILGASSGNSSHLMWFAGMDQCDSANWRIKAAFGKISLLGKSEIKISKRKSSFGNNAWKPEYDRLLKECECPICKHLSLSQRKEILASSFKSRAVHNAFVYLQERQLAQEFIGKLAYKRYLEKRFERSYFCKKFLSKIAESRHQKTLDACLKMP